MTTYYNQKEDVIEFELTQYGIQKLKEGKLNPCYYSFHDDEVYYGDPQTDEDNRRMKHDDNNRIHNKSSYLSIFPSNAKNFKEIHKYTPKSSGNSIELYVQNWSNISHPLGKCDKGPDSPQIEIKFYDEKISLNDSEISKTALLRTGSSPNTTNENIPLIDLGEVECNIAVKKVDDLANKQSVYSSAVFQDRTYIDIDIPEVLFSIEESNVEDSFENFEIELYYENNTNSDTWTPILQPPRYQENLILDDILVDHDNEEELIEFNKLYSRELKTSDIMLIETDEHIADDVYDSFIRRTQSSENKYLSEKPGVYDNKLSGPFGEECDE